MSLPSRPRPVVLVTGASAGIGAALARVYAEHGWDLVLTARREGPLKALAEDLSHTGATTTVLTEDLADPAAPRRLFDAIAQRGLTVDGLINNAGFSRTAGFLNTDPAAHAAMIRVMLSAPVELARLFAPAMVERGYGRILNIASLAGQMPATGGDTLYGPIKSFLIKASQGLHLELRGTGVHVTALCPGYTLTEFHDVNGTREEVSTAYPAWMWQTADHVARVGYAACEANRPKVTPGAMNNLLAGLAKHLPDRMALNMVGGHAKRLKRI
ncbi:MAG: SDR family oxidoreductase [Brevundimonas sp.]|uniref:SDR family NAD(P)-dependent oxidoreductase n=1 Tax=Brevundimonas sp. TaxID=1871086 RepID=UPI0024882C56|nr:SDR family oxidoreductase [Brevundimonas sp.]MDI1328086.1 SDR family oxidoreductase [Brevundimonas sp.]